MADFPKLNMITRDLTPEMFLTSELGSSTVRRMCITVEKRISLVLRTTVNFSEVGLNGSYIPYNVTSEILAHCDQNVYVLFLDLI